MGLPADRVEGKRAHPRFDVAVPVRIGDAPGVLYTRELSAGGMFLRMEAPPSAGSAVELRLLLPGIPREVAVAGVVAFSRPFKAAVESARDAGAGIRFVSFEAGVREILDAFLDSVRRQTKTRALVVFQRALDRDVVSRALRSLRATVATAMSTAAALDVARFGGFDVVLSDLALHESDGISLCARLRAMRPEAVPFVLFGDRIVPEDRKRAYDAGVSRILMKPIHRLEVLRVVDELVPTGLVDAIEPLDELRALALQAQEAGDVEIALEALSTLVTSAPEDEIARAALRELEKSLMPAERIDGKTRIALAVPAEELPALAADLTIEDAFLVSRLVGATKTVDDLARDCGRAVTDASDAVRACLASRILRIV